MCVKIFVNKCRPKKTNDSLDRHLPKMSACQRVPVVKSNINAQYPFILSSQQIIYYLMCPESINN